LLLTDDKIRFFSISRRFACKGTHARENAEF